MDNYLVGRRVGAGTYGSVYLAHDRRLKQPDSRLFCLKKIDLAFCSDSERAAATREASLLKRLDHPGVCGYWESFMDEDDHLVLVMDYCASGDLFAEVKSRVATQCHFDEDEIMDLFVQVAKALEYVHSQKVLHRDLKTSNIFVQEDGRLQLGDFGISKALEGSCADTVVGTPFYMSPELCRGERYGYKSDVWALGCVLHELCSLRAPFFGTNLLGVVYQIVERPPPPLPAQYSTPLRELVDQLLTKDACERPSLKDVLAMPLAFRWRVYPLHPSAKGR